MYPMTKTEIIMKADARAEEMGYASTMGNFIAQEFMVGLQDGSDDWEAAEHRAIILYAQFGRV